MPLISVVVPVFNGEKTIKETVESILQQTFNDIEIIVINDGSQDATLGILQSISDSRLRILSFPNAGLAASRNRGIEQARGKYIAFIDADDLWTPDKLELQLKALQDSPESAVAYSWTDYIDESSQFLYSGKHLTFNGNVYDKILVDNFLENGSNPLILKQIFQHVGNFDESLTAAEDWDMYLRLAACCQFIAVSSPQILYRVSTNSMSAQILRQEAQCLKVLNRAFAKAPTSLHPLKKHAFANLYRYLAYKAIEGYPSAANGVAAAKCFGNYIRYNPALLKQGKVILGMGWRIAVMLFLPPQKARSLLNSSERSSAVSQLSR